VPQGAPNYDLPPGDCAGAIDSVAYIPIVVSVPETEQYSACAVPVLVEMARTTGAAMAVNAMAVNKPVCDDARKGSVKKRTQLHTKNDRPKDLDQARQNVRRIHGSEKIRCQKEVQGRSPREVKPIRRTDPRSPG
jgi:hypothetical protein